MKNFKYYVHTHPGGIYSAMDFVSAFHPDWDIVSVVPGIENLNHTLIVHRVPAESPAESPAPELNTRITSQIAINAAFHRAQSIPWRPNSTTFTMQQAQELNEGMLEIYTILLPFVSKI